MIHAFLLFLSMDPVGISYAVSCLLKESLLLALRVKIPIY